MSVGSANGEQARRSAPRQVLVVDDEEAVRRTIGRTLIQSGYECTLASTTAETRALLGDRHFQLAICDVVLPDASGLDLLREMHVADPTLAILMISSRDDPMVAEIAAERGAFGYLVKPLAANALLIGVTNALHRRRHEIEEHEYRARLEEAVHARTAELRAAIAELTHSRQQTLHGLSRAVEMRDIQTGGHVERIGDYSALIAEGLGMGSERVELIRAAAPMHDVGKIGIPDRILLKPGQLNDEERLEMQRHTEIGRELLTGTNSQLLDLAATIAATHHERFDGGGYPSGLRGEEIPLEGRIVAVADVFDALTHERVYRSTMSVDDALRTIEEGRGTQFDPVVFDAFISRLGSILELDITAGVSARGVSGGT
jgi:putative two-component system response regulator